MKKFYMIALLATLLLGLSAQAQITDTPVQRPKTKAGAPENGKTYVMVSAYSPLRHYSNLTSWDNAVYLTQDIEFEFTAIQNEDKTWSFTRQDGDKTLYMITREGDGNLRWNSEEQTKWLVEPGDFEGFVRLKAGEGNGESQQKYYVHLNAGAEYIIVSCPGFPFYPDFAGGMVENPDIDGEEEYLSDETGRFLMADHTSENWAFIAKEDWTDFTQRYEIYYGIQKLEGDQYDIDEYITGFKATYNAVVAIYNGDWEPETDGQTMLDMINNKIALFERIEYAYSLDVDLMLQNAINEAQNAFDTKTSAADVEAALSALNDAIFQFESGAGDYTGLIKNPSFEDLSSQGGNQTSGVAGAPAGWNVFINNVQVTTADEVRNAGIYNWHGINDDCDGEGKDGNYGFGIWTAGVPDYEISQTIEGLECGTYTVTAGVMVGANGNGSRRTTQRLFGNLNTTYFGSSSEYDADLLELGEVRDFAGLPELTTDRTLQLMSVRAYVYDGTLTFGLRTDGNIKAALRETNNPNSGDGWFKLDNFHIQKEGYFGSEAANVANTFLNMFKAYQDRYMQKELTEKIQGLVKTYSEKTAESPKEEINAMISSLYGQLGLLDEVKACIEQYDRLSKAIEDGYVSLEEYLYNKGADEYAALLEAADQGYQQGSYAAEEIDGVIQRLNEKLEEVIKAGVAVGEYINVIKNPSFEDLSAQGNRNSDGIVNPPAGWTLKFNDVLVTDASQYSGAGANVGWCAINGGDPINADDENGNNWTHQYTDGSHLWGIWGGNMPEVELSQTIEGLPAGTYILECDMIVEHNWGGYNVTTQRIFGNDYVQMYADEATYAEGLNDTPDMAQAKKVDAKYPEAGIKHLQFAGWQSVQYEAGNNFTSCPYPMALTFGVYHTGTAHIGFRTNNVNPQGVAHHHDSAGWFKLDNFRLYYESTDIPVGISTMEMSGAATQVVGRQFFTADGRQVAQPGRGITIVRNLMSDGSVKAVKVIK